MKIIGLLKVGFCWGSMDGICISCEVPSIADTTLGISFATRLGWLATEFT